jgi:hypothetical protein
LIKKILFFGVLLLLGMAISHSAFAQSQRNCTPNTICAQTGDYLKYSAQAFNSKGTISYNFGNFIDSHTIKVSISTVIGNVTTSSQSILNLKNTTLINNDGSRGPFFFMVLTPIYPSIVSASPFKDSTDSFNGYQRTTLLLDASNGTDSEKVEVDKETGVLLVYKISHVMEISGQPVSTGTSFTLNDTNLITSSDIQEASAIPSNNPVVPSNTPGMISNTPSTPNTVSGDNKVIIYIGIAIAVGAAGGGIAILQKRKSKKVSKTSSR